MEKCTTKVLKQFALLSKYVCINDIFEEINCDFIKCSRLAYKNNSKKIQAKMLFNFILNEMIDDAIKGNMVKYDRFTIVVTKTTEANSRVYKNNDPYAFDKGFKFYSLFLYLNNFYRLNRFHIKLTSLDKKKELARGHFNTTYLEVYQPNGTISDRSVYREVSSKISPRVKRGYKKSSEGGV